MVHLQIRGAGMAGHEVVVRHFPFSIGRAPDRALRLQAPGVWAEHAELHWRPGGWVELRSSPPARTYLNGTPTEQGVLRQGDEIELGGVRLRFWLSPARQAGLVGREALAWAGLAAGAVVQVLLIVWLGG
jgi:pSer/pThr/pTyr-binding forkhead associated (FHA) protein